MTVDALIPQFDAAFDCLEANDLDGFLEIAGAVIDPEVEVNSAIGSVVVGDTYKGLDGIREWFSEFLENSRRRSWRERSYETFGDDAIAFLCVLTFEGAASQVPVTSENGVVFRFRAGRCVFVDSFMSHDEAREFAKARSA